MNLLAGHHEIAIRNLRNIDDDPHSVFRPYVQSLIFEALIGCGQNQAAIDLGEAILADKRSDDLPLELWENLIDIYISGDSLDKAVRLASNLTRRRMGAEEAARIACKEIDLLYQLGRTAAAKEKAVSLARKYPGEIPSIRSVRWVLAKTAREDLSAEEQILFAKILMQHGELSEAKKLLVGLGKQRLDPADMERRKILLADLFYRESKFSQAAELARQKYTSPDHKKFSLLILARCYRRMGRPLSSARLYEDYAASYPADGKAGEALFVAAELYTRINEQTRATRTLELLADKYPSGYFGHIAMLKLAWQHQRQGRDDKSAEILQRTLRRSRGYKETTLYYLAEAYRRLGRLTEREQVLKQLAEHDSLSFYLDHSVEISLPQQLMSSSGMIEMQGENGLIGFLKEVTVKKAEAFEQIMEFLPESDDRSAYGEGIKHMETAAIFLEMGFRDWGAKELSAAEASLRPSKRLIFDLAMQYDHYGLTWNSMKCFQYIWDSIHGEDRRRLSQAFSLLLHPLPFPVQVFENCARQGLPPHLVYAMIRAESGFNKSAVSRAGAMGLMQLMPGTGRDVARHLDLPDDFGEDLFSPEINLAFGIWYASFLFSKCGEDPYMMLAAYNAGLANAKRWFRYQEEQTVPRVVDGITYKETRNYVKKIVESSHVYRNLYFNAGGFNGSSGNQQQ